MWYSSKLELEIKKAAKEFFSEAYQQGISGVHSVQIEGNILLYDYLGAFENSEVRIPKILEFLASLQLGKQGMLAKEEFYQELENNEDQDMGEPAEDEGNNNGGFDDDDALQNLMTDWSEVGPRQWQDSL